jgi:glycosyltransferase involved in cell wall biosynthesis
MGWLMQDDYDRTVAELGIADRIVRPGFVPHAELPAFYGAADAFVFPTHYEGFGLPLLEALHCGCPVVTSDNSSVPEVTGDAALRTDSNDIDAFAAAVRRVLDDPALRDDLIAKGRAHAARYSWRSCAEATMRVYESLAT